ncbi:XtrA/YqaO family protein [Cytobacillus sp. Hm23]|uniref:XtrA/YqaO family protein n=1 Tax=Cytobacillus sp. IB215665 TaxID=3097357 RepID=UPI002A14FCF4|nr:XtrA/YqaO family protein [Cytobacillus sp. IB215665]MDX8365301.1 XtrA/YqaO family protein [Cytobacillus sp. IB215665]
MRMKEIDITDSMFETNVNEQQTPYVVIVSNGKAKISQLPSHGETKIITHQNEVKRVKFDEGEEF